MKIDKRKTMLNVVSTLLKALWVFPMKKRRILFYSFGGQFSDSPKYIYEYLKKKNLKFDYVWVSKMENQGIPNDCKCIKGSGIGFFYYLSTSKMIVVNDYINTYYPRRRGQIIINTWHGGSPLKTAGMVGTEVSDEEKDFFHRHDKIYSLFLSSSSFMTGEVFRKSFGFTGPIFESGMPRNAILLREHQVQESKVRSYFNINADKGIVLYAPTFRGNAKAGGFLNKDQQFDVKKCLGILEKKFNREFVFLFRAHHAFKDDIESADVCIASDYPDMQELLCASDILITDYSSCMGDEALMNKPTFLFCPDLEEYQSERGFYWDIYSLPFPVFKDEASFLQGIVEFDESLYKKNIKDYLDRLGSFENKDSDKIVGDFLIDLMEGRRFISNECKVFGITEEYRNFNNS